MRQLRKNSGLSPKTIQELTGCSHATVVYKLEAGKRILKADELILLADIYETTIDYILFGSLPSKQS